MPQGTTVSYNGIAMSLVKTNDIRETPQYTPDGMDYLWTEVILDINTVYNAAQTAYQGDPPVATPGTLPAVTYKSVEKQLSVPRGRLIINNYINNLFDEPENDITDVNNGPFPVSVRVFRIDGGSTFHVNFVIRFYINKCQNGAWISNRFSQSFHYDENFYETIVTRGRAFFRVDVLDSTGTVADAFRDQLLPKIPLGYRRRPPTQFRVDSTRNIIEYECVDIEFPYDLGDTGGSGSGTYVTNVDAIYRQATVDSAEVRGVGGIAGGMQYAIMQVKMQGSKRANNWVMTQLAFALMASTKMDFRAANKPVKSIEISQSVTDRYVDITVVQFLPPTGNGIFGGFDLNGLRFGNDASSNPLQQNGGINPVLPSDNGTRGFESLISLGSALVDMCDNATAGRCWYPYGGGGETPAASLYCGPSPAAVVAPATIIPSSPQPYSPQTQYRSYPEAQIQSRYETDHGVKQAPYATPPSGYTPGGGGSGSTSDEPTCSIMTLHAPITRRVVDWSCVRFGAPPQFPAMKSSDPNQVLMSSTLAPMDVEAMIDGTPVFRVSGTYTYALKRDITQLSSIPYDLPQWVSWPYGGFQIDMQSGGAQVTGLIGPDSSGQGSGDA